MKEMYRGLATLRRKFRCLKPVNRVDSRATRLGAFITVFTTIALWEAVAPRQARSYSRLKRWPSNLVTVALNTVLVRVLIPPRRWSGLAETTAGVCNNLPVPADGGRCVRGCARPCDPLST
jgi:hypothetical protein